MVIIFDNIAGILWVYILSASVGVSRVLVLGAVPADVFWGM